MGVTIDTSQARALGARVAGNGARLGAQGSAVLRRTALAIEADAKVLAPVDTGDLEASISTTFTGDGRSTGITAEIGPTVEYGIYQEYGTSTQPGKPFMGPAFDRQAPGFTAALAAMAEKII